MTPNLETSPHRFGRESQGAGPLGINLLPYEPFGQGGAEVFIRNLVSALADLPFSRRIVLFIQPGAEGAYVPSGDSRFHEHVIPAAYGSRGKRVVAEQLVLPKAVASQGIKWLFSNYVSPVMAPCKQLVTIHDALYRIYPECIEPKKLWYWRLMIPLSLLRARKVFTVSQYSADDIARLFPVARTRISVFSEGIDKAFFEHLDEEDPAVLQRLGINKPFIVCAATFGPNKNIPTLLRAFAIVARNHPSVCLVMTGRRERVQDQLGALMAELDIQDRVTLPGFVSTPELAVLYRNAELHVMPSRFEGFGLSVIEAQHFGCPLVCSRATCLPEIAGKGAILVDPDDPVDMARGMDRVLSEPELRAQLIERGHENAQQYSWERAARALLQATGGFH